MKNIVIKKSKISGRGIFAFKNFNKGEVVLRWKPKFINKSDLKKLSKKQLSYVNWYNNRYVRMQSPEKYVNHSCEANTKALNGCDIATRNIKKGEEITSDYKCESEIVLFEKFKCECGSKKCKGYI